MKALSLTQPMAWAVVSGGKDIENRAWRTPHRGPFYVHASMGWNKEHYKFIDELGIIMPSEWIHGAIIGEADLTALVIEGEDDPRAKSRWFMGPVGFALRNMKAYEEPIYCKGQLGFFDVDNVRRDENSGRMVADSKFSNKFR